MRYIKCTSKNGLKKQTIARACGPFIHSLSIFLVRLFKIMRRRINEIIKLFSGLLLIISILYIFGQAGSMDLNQISITQYIVRSSIGLAILAADTVLINHLDWKEEEG